MGRPLSSVENVFWLVDKVARQNIVIVAQLSGVLPGPRLILRKALDITQQNHPPLRWKIKEDKVPQFDTKGVQAIPLRIIERKNEEQWIEEAENEMDLPFPFSQGPLARAVLLAAKDENKYDLLFTFCHVPTDGISCVMVMKELLNTIDKLSRGEPVPPPEPHPEPLPGLELLRKNLAYPPAFFEIGERIRRVFHKPVQLRGDQEVPPEKRRTRIIHRSFSLEETRELAARCKKEKTTVHGALCAAFFQALVEQVRRAGGVSRKGPLNVGCFSPVNIRHLFTRPVDRDMGYYISIAQHYQLIDDKSPLWSAAREVKKSLSREIKYGRDIKALQDVGGLLKTYSTPLEFTRNINKFNPPVVATNLGRLDIPERFGNISVEAFHALGAIHFDAKSGLCIAASTFRGCLQVIFLYAEPYISKKRADKIGDNTMKRIRDALFP